MLLSLHVKPRLVGPFSKLERLSFLLPAENDARDETRVNQVHVILCRSNNWVIRVMGVFGHSINGCLPRIGFSR